ncbi:MAG: glycoside hydrolase [Lachnospiraceae bacterium]|jgi:GH25 family lysozyme M1 (1,4-beta-N-acetylmuramidase)|nr:glycoside hydrolase [Lachnospiraceae bacterium]
MSNNKKTAVFYLVGILIMIGLLIFIFYGVKSVLNENATNDDMALSSEDLTTEATTTEEITTEITTEATTEEVTEEPTTEEIEDLQLIELGVADDVTPPVFLGCPETIELKVDQAFVADAYVSYADDIDRNPVLTTEGTVDYTVPGNYPVKLTLTDEAGHSTVKDITVKVVEEYTTYNPTEKPKEDFSTFASVYKNDNTTLGIDVSRWQEDVDFNLVKQAGCDFVIIRIGGYDEGSTYTDRYFKDNIANAKAAGLKVGIYWHAEESNVEQVRENVRYMLDVLGGEELDFPIAYDWEDFSHFQDYKMSINDLNNCLEVFYGEVKKYGYDACIYGSKNYLDSVWKNMGNHPVWLANYVDSTTYSGDYYMWQQSNTGRIPGVNGDVDLNILYNDRYVR